MVYFLLTLVVVLITGIGVLLQRQQQHKKLYQISRQQLKESQIQLLQLRQKLQIAQVQDSSTNAEIEANIQAQVQVQLDLRLKELDLWEDELTKQERALASHSHELEQRQKLTEQNQQLEAVMAQLTQRNSELAQDLKYLYEQIASEIEQGVVQRTAELQTQIENMRSQNAMLNTENQRLYSQPYPVRHRNLETEAVQRLYLQSQEPDLYGQEKLGIILEILHKSLLSTQDYTRRQTVITDLLDCNDNPSERADLEAKIRQLFTGYRRMNDSLRSELRRLGFELISENNHYKFYFRGDSRYPIILPKTSSDERRGGANIASQICNQLF
jgi:hypothetical protein